LLGTVEEAEETIEKKKTKKEEFVPKEGGHDE
jgi:hypothetical protein